MDLKALLPKSHAFFHLKAMDRSAVFRQLVSPLVESKIVTDADAFIADLIRREDQITTQIHPDIALPHARSEAVRRLGLSIGIADPPGLVFNPAVGECCRIIFLIAIPACSPTAHLTLLQHLVHFANDPKRMEKLLACQTPAQVSNCIVTFKWKP